MERLLKEASVVNRTGGHESYQVTLCEICMDHTSSTQWELRMPNGSKVFLKTDTEEERRAWLRVLGSMKACMMDTSPLTHLKQHSSDLDAKNNLRDNVNQDLLDASSGSGSGSTSDLPEEKEVEGFQEVTITKNMTSNREGMTREKFDSLCYEIKKELEVLQRSFHNEDSENDFLERLEMLTHTFAEFTTVAGNMVQTPSNFSGDNMRAKRTSNEFSVDSGVDVSKRRLSPSEPTGVEGVTVASLFTTFRVQFRRVVTEVEECSEKQLLSAVRTETYLDACVSYTEFFNIFGGNLFAPLRSDILSNAEKVKRGFERNRLRYAFLQNIIIDEIARKQERDSDSTTQAVRWMMRGLRTIAAFFRYCCTPGHPGYRNTGVALEVAYRESLKRHHNFLVQKMFLLGIKLLPTFDNMIKQVCYGVEMQIGSRQEVTVMNQVIAYSEDMCATIRLIEKVYLHYNLVL